jgi:hypothetical protein
LKRPHLEHTGNDGDGVRQQVIEVFVRLDETAFRFEPNRSSYRGRSYRLLSGAPGLCLTGVKRGPTIRWIAYRYVNVGSAMIGLMKTGLAAVEAVIAWRSIRSSRSQRKSGTGRRDAVTMELWKERQG